MSSRDTRDEEVRQATPTVEQGRDLHYWVNLYGMIILTAATVVIAVVAFLFQRTQSDQASVERARIDAAEIQRRYESLRDSRRAQQVQVATALIPNIITGSETDRRYALIALAQAAPREVIELLDVAQERATSDRERTFVRDIRNIASNRELVDEFFGQLGLAREYAAFNFADQACLAFVNGWNRLPESFAGQIDYEKIDAGLSRCSSANRAEGTRNFREAFAKIQTR